MMNLQIQAIKFDAEESLINHIKKKMNKLERFEDSITTANIYLKQDNDTSAGDKVVTVNIKVRGAELVAERRSHIFEESFDNCFDAIKSQIESRKN